MLLFKYLQSNKGISTTPLKNYLLNGSRDSTLETMLDLFYNVSSEANLNILFLTNGVSIDRRLSPNLSTFRFDDGVDALLNNIMHLDNMGELPINVIITDCPTRIDEESRIGISNLISEVRTLDAKTNIFTPYSVPLSDLGTKETVVSPMLDKSLLGFSILDTSSTRTSNEASIKPLHHVAYDTNDIGCQQ